MLIRSDVIEGGLTVTDGIAEATRTFVIQIPDTTAPHAKAWQAYRSQNIPQTNDGHPSIPGIVARRFDVESREGDPSIMQVNVTYQERPTIETDIELGATGQTVELQIDTFTENTIFDVNGEIMQVRFTFTSLSAVEDGAEAGQQSFGGGIGVSQLLQTLEFQVERPTVTVRITEEQNVLPKQLILDGFVGAVNAVDWSGFPPLTWLMRGVTASPVSADRFNVTSTLTYNKNTWRAEGRVNQNGAVPENATLENGIVFFKLYPELDFNSLGISF